MTKSNQGLADIETYNSTAPQIVVKINQCQNPESIYEQLLVDYISPAVSLIEHGEYTQAYDLYREMVNGLQSRYLKELPDTDGGISAQENQ